MKAKSSDRHCSRTKAALCVVLICSMFTVYVQPGLAITLPAPRTHAQLLTGLLSTNHFIVRDSLGLYGINLTCLLLGCNVLQGLGDPNGQLFLVQNTGLLSPTAFLA